jgi:hypothetical protein
MQWSVGLFATFNSRLIRWPHLRLALPSHFVIDAIPHWDYPLRSISVAPGARNQVRLTSALARDIALIGLDAVVGLVLAIGIFATPSTIVAILAGAVGAMLPDPLQFVHTIYPHEPLASLQRFHRWIHTKRQLHWPMALSHHKWPSLLLWSEQFLR